jgi:hypothetical protein
MNDSIDAVKRARVDLACGDIPLMIATITARECAHAVSASPEGRAKWLANEAAGSRDENGFRSTHICFQGV